jgi:hypothetical protein
MSSSCEEIKRLLTEYALQESPRHDRDAIEGHVPHCLSCREELEDIRGTLGLLQRAEEVQELPRNIRVVTHAPAAAAGGTGNWWTAFWSNTGRMALAGGALACLAVGLLSISQARITYKPGDVEIAFGAKPPVAPALSQAQTASGILPASSSDSIPNQLTRSQIEALITAAVQASELRQKSTLLGLVRDASLKTDERRSADVQQMAETFRYMHAAQTNLWKEQVQSQQIVAVLAQKNGISLTE